MTDILLRNILGAEFDEMPEAVRCMDSTEQTRGVRGISRVMGGKNPLSWLIRVIAGLPDADAPGADYPIHQGWRDWRFRRDRRHGGSGAEFRGMGSSFR
jgi:hypothetical protein